MTFSNRTWSGGGGGTLDKDVAQRVTLFSIPSRELRLSLGLKCSMNGSGEYEGGKTSRLEFNAL